VDLDEATLKLAALDGRKVDGQLLAHGEVRHPLTELSGVLSVVRSTTGAADGAVRLWIGDGSLWLWPDRFVAGSRLGDRGALELVTEDGVFIVGPAAGEWID
jgi:hypothetical protein